MQLATFISAAFVATAAAQSVGITLYSDNSCAQQINEVTVQANSCLNYPGVFASASLFSASGDAKTLEIYSDSNCVTGPGVDTFQVGALGQCFNGFLFGAGTSLNLLGN